MALFDAFDWARVGYFMSELSRQNGDANIRVTQGGQAVCGQFVAADRPTLEYVLRDRFFNPYAKDADGQVGA